MQGVVDNHIAAPVCLCNVRLFHGKIHFIAHSTAILFEDIEFLQQDHFTLDIRHEKHRQSFPEHHCQPSVFAYGPQGEDMHIRT